MSLVSRLQTRLDLRVPGPTPEDRGLALRLRKRIAADRPEPSLVGSTVRLSPVPTSKALKTVKAEPNAPLLMRLVRFPYALAVTPPRRVPAIEPRPRHHVDLLRATFSAEVSTLRDALKPPGALKSIGDRRPRTLPRPFARTRAESASSSNGSGE